MAFVYITAEMLAVTGGHPVTQAERGLLGPDVQEREVRPCAVTNRRCPAVIELRARLDQIRGALTTG